MHSKLTALQTISDIRPQTGGTARVVVDLADALSKHPSIQPVIVTQSFKNDETLPSSSARVQRMIIEARPLNSLRFGVPFYKHLRDIVNSQEKPIIHNHGLWAPENHWAAHLSRSNNIPMVSQPHGMLEPWSLSQKAWKKHVALMLFQRTDLTTAKALIATSSEEYENLRQLGLKQPIAVIPNGVRIDVPADINLDQRLPIQKIKTALFLSRVHQKKGLSNLIRAWAQIRSLDWKLQIAGPDEGGHLQEVMTLASELGIDKSIDYVGTVEGEKKAELYRSANLFVLPTHSENFGVVIAEALANGVPVITTRGAPWSDLETFKCGWWVDIGVKPLVHALCDAMALSDDERRAMGERGREYVQRYNWDIITNQTVNVYRWALNISPAPECLRMN